MIAVWQTVQHILPSNSSSSFSVLSGQQGPELTHLLDTHPCAAPRDAHFARPKRASQLEVSDMTLMLAWI